MNKLRSFFLIFTVTTVWSLISCSGCRSQFVKLSEAEGPESYDAPADNDSLFVFDFPSEEEKQIYDDLCAFIEQDKLDSLRYMFENSSIDLTKYDKDKQHYKSILYVASWRGNPDVMKFLIGKGADPKARTSSNETALHRVAWQGNLPAVKLLVGNGAELNVIYRANGGLSPLCCAVESGNPEVVKYLISNGANPRYEHPESGVSPLRSAANYGNYDIFRLLVDYLPSDYDWQETLFYGLIGGDLDIVKYVVEKKGVDVNKKSEVWKAYPIEKAAQYRYRISPSSRPVEVVEYLLEKGARLTDINNGQIMEWAMRHCSEEMITYFIDQGVKVELPEPEDDWTHLARALDGGNYAIARHLIRNTEDYTFRGKPLIVYFADGLYDVPCVIQLLIEEGVNKENYTEALQNCVVNNDSASIELLCAAGADIHATDYLGGNVLHKAQSYPIAKLLIQKGADTQNRYMLKYAWKNPPLLWALEEAGVIPPLSRENMNQALSDAALVGDLRTVEYMLKRGAQVNSCPPPAAASGSVKRNQRPSDPSDIRVRRAVVNDEDGPIHGQTPLIKNAIQGYGCRGCTFEDEYGYQDAEGKMQVPSGITKRLLKAGANPDMTDSRGRTALHYVASDQWYRLGMWPIPMGSRRERERGSHGDPAPPPEQYHDSIARLLIDHNAQLNIRDRDGYTPLMLAAQSGNHAVMKMLLDAGSDINARNNQGKTLFYYLSNPVSLQVIYNAGLSQHVPKNMLNAVFRTFFIEQIRDVANPAEQLKWLIDYGVDVNTNVYDKNVMFYLFGNLYIKSEDKYQIAQLLIDHGVNLYAETYSGFTLPMFLIREMHQGDKYSEKKTLADLNFLIRNNIDLNYRSSNQFTMLGIALSEEKKIISDLLFKHGAQRNCQSEWWYLLRERRSYAQTMPMLRKLVLEGVDVDLQTPTVITNYIPKVEQPGVTALMLYVAYGRVDEVKALIDMKANVNLRASDGTTALDIARDIRREDIVNILIKAGAK